MKAADSWATYKLGDCIKLLSGGTPSKAKEEYWGGNIPWISNKDMKVTRIYESEDYLSDLGAKNGTRLVPEGTILIVVRGMVLANKFPVAMAMRMVSFNQDLKAIECISRLIPQFLFYWLQGKEYEMLGLADEAAHGTKRIQTDRLLSHPIELPDPDNQRPILIFGDHTCKMQLMTEPFSIGPNVVPFSPRDNMPSSYIYFLLQNLVETKEYKRHWTELMNKYVIVSFEEIIQVFAHFANHVFEGINMLMHKNQNLRCTRDLLLHKLISGELNVENLEIEVEGMNS